MKWLSIVLCGLVGAFLAYWCTIVLMTGEGGYTNELRQLPALVAAPIGGVIGGRLGVQFYTFFTKGAANKG